MEDNSPRDNRYVLSVFFLTWALVFGLLRPEFAFPESNKPGASFHSDDTLRVGINPLFRPFSFIDDKGKRVGVDLDIAGLLAQNMAVKLKVIVPDTFDRLIPMLLNGDIDIIMAAMSRTFKRAQQVAFTVPYFRTGVTILLNRKTGYEIGIGETKRYKELIDTLKFLNNENKLKIIVVKGKAPEQSVRAFFPKATIIEYPGNEAAVEALYQGKAHIMVHDEIFLKSWFAKNRARALYKLRVFDKPYKPDTYGFAVTKGNCDVLNMLNIFIEDKLLNEGYLERFMKKYSSGYMRESDDK
jgi:polar amino acid transport system substrate-binding protein